MSEQQRPGGLTALAVINFVFAGVETLSLLGLVSMRAGLLSTDELTEAQRAPIEAIQNMGLPMFIAIFAGTLVIAALLLLSGIGYLKQKRFMGRLLGNGYAVLSIVSGIYFGAVLSPELGGGFNFIRILELVYPALTLIFINTTFKDDLTN